MMDLTRVGKCFPAVLLVPLRIRMTLHDLSYLGMARGSRKIGGKCSVDRGGTWTPSDSREATSEYHIIMTISIFHDYLLFVKFLRKIYGGGRINTCHN